ncbi:hypothetical protein AB1Y20_002609 [Prymnesium parvum]|uniref:Altered inheritance of mitochondria protein 24, mitochondrial n=1 Tax=Prymnesium parvum TaxID=97485 RepID=A0AB34J9T2_PRYPA
MADLRELERSSVPRELTVAHYVDLHAAASRGYAHVEYLSSAHDVGAVLDGLSGYIAAVLAARQAEMLAAGKEELHLDGALLIGHAAAWKPTASSCLFKPERMIGKSDGGSAVLLLSAGVKVYGGCFDVSQGPIFLGEEVAVECGVLVRGPAVIEARTTLRHGAYLRGDCLLGADGVFGGELKGVLALDGAELPHQGYCGDSILGYRAHFGCQALTANFPLFAGSSPSVCVRYLLGRRKFGAVVGDHCQLGCGTVTEPGCLMAPNTFAYPLLPHGLYGPDELIKNRPHESGVIVRTPITGEAANAA